MASTQSFPLTARKPISLTAPAALIPTFAIAFIIFIILPSLMSAQFGPYPLIKVEDVFLLLTPLVMIPLYWQMLRESSANKVDARVMIVFLALAAMWADGHGIKLAANSIGHWLEDLQGTNAYQTTYFYDEILGHYWWHLAIFGLSALVIAREWRSPFAGSHIPGLAIGIGIVHGISLFLIIVEGQTVPAGLPFAMLFALFGLIWGRRKLGSQPWFTFFWTSYLTAAVLMTAWWLYWGSFIEIFDAMKLI